MASLVLIALLSVIGPWSAFNVSLVSQRNRFINILEKYNMLENGEIVLPDKPVTKEDKERISDILAYFNENHSYAVVGLLPEDFKRSQMPEVFGFEYQKKGFWDFFYYNRDATEVIEIKGYDYMFFSNGIEKMGNSQAANDVRVDVSSNENRLIVFLREIEIYTLDLREEARKIVLRNKSTNLPTNEMTFIGENELVRVKIIYNHINGQTLPEAKPEIKNVDYYLLLDIK